jgi:hypothetical protein
MSICFVVRPFGRLAIEADDKAVSAVRRATPRERGGARTKDKSSSPVPREAARQLPRLPTPEARTNPIWRGRAI